MDEGRRNGGAGFVARFGERYWLITAAHVPLRSKEFYLLDRWPGSIWVDTPSQSLAILTKSLDTLSAKPLFRYQLHALGMLDVVAFSLSGPLPDVKTYDLGADVDCQPGMQLHGYGFPSTSNPPTWPAAHIQGQVTENCDPYVFTTLPIVEGYSGGPLVTAAGDLAGIMIGYDGELGTTFSAKLFRPMLA